LENAAGQRTEAAAYLKTVAPQKVSAHFRTVNTIPLRKVYSDCKSDGPARDHF
jgi:hypothetical protein